MFSRPLAKEKSYMSAHSLGLRKKQPVLIVDDSMDDRILLARFLQSFLADHQPVVSLKGGQALLTYLQELEFSNAYAEEFEREIPAMIFLDLLMPHMDGIETLKALRKQILWADVPVTLITCSRNDKAIEEAENAGANAFLPKPFTKLDVMQALKKSTNFAPTLM